MKQPEDKKGRFFTPGTIIVFIMLFACIYCYLYIIISTLTGTHMGRNQSMEAEVFVIGGTEILTVIAAVVTLATVIASTIIAYKKDNERLSHTKETLSKEHTALQQLIQGDIAETREDIVETRNDINEVRSDIGRTDATVTKIWEKALQQQQAASKLPDSASFLNSAQAMWNENARLHMEIEHLSTANRNQELELQRMEAENQKLRMRIARYSEKEQGRDR